MPKLYGGEVVVRALEDEGVRFTFGIPGTHNTELYDALDRSDQIIPILVTDEQSASFMADAVSRSSNIVGVANVVPGAGLTNSLSGIGEAFMDNVPMVVIACGIRNDLDKAYQLHAVDQLGLARPITKAALRPANAADIYATVRKAFAIARQGTPGPVVVEIPANYLLFTGEFVPEFESPAPLKQPEPNLIAQAAVLLNAAHRPALYLGQGARAAEGLLVQLAEALQAPVVTTIQGKGVFSETNPLWLWCCFGRSAPDFVNQIMDDCDCLLAIGCRFGEVATASYGLKTPENLIHVDINPEVFHKNYPAKFAVESDSRLFVEKLLPHLKPRSGDGGLKERIRLSHAELWRNWLDHKNEDKVSAARFMKTLQQLAGKEAIYVTDSGNGTFLAMEFLRLQSSRSFLGPIDYSCMGYSVPGAIGAKLANPGKRVVGLIGDGAFLMTGFEMLTAGYYNVGAVFCLLHDGELAQIAQLQRATLNRDTCTILPNYDAEAFCRSVHVDYFRLNSDSELDSVLSLALAKADGGRPVMVDVNIDYSHRTFFTQGVIKTNFLRLPWPQRMAKAARSVWRHITPRPEAKKPESYVKQA